MKTIIISTVVSTLITMFLIYLIKKVSIQYSVPVLKEVSEGI